MIESEALKIIKRPYITEKTFDIMEKQNKMVFIVEENSNKYPSPVLFTRFPLCLLSNGLTIDS